MKYRGIKISKEMLNDPILLELQKKDAETVRLAVESLNKVNECVCPIYTSRGGPNRAPTYIGCGAVVVVDQLHYLLTAAHVVEPYLDNLMISAGEATFKLPDWRYFTSAIRAKEFGLGQIDDDVAIIPLRGEIPVELRSIALTEDHFDSANPPNDATTHVIIGFLASEAGVRGLALTGQQKPMPVYELPDALYSQMGFDRRKKIVLSYVPYRIKNGNIEKTPTPRGMSGGAIFRIVGLPGSIDLEPSGTLVPKLAGIFQERRDEREPLPAMSLGARLGAYLDLIAAYVLKIQREDLAAKRIY